MRLLWSPDSRAKKFTFFHDKFTSNQIGTIVQTFKNNNIINKNRISKSFSISFQNHVRSFVDKLHQIKLILCSKHIKTTISSTKKQISKSFSISKFHSQNLYVKVICLFFFSYTLQTKEKETMVEFGSCIIWQTEKKERRNTYMYVLICTYMNG